MTLDFLNEMNTQCNYCIIMFSATLIFRRHNIAEILLKLALNTNQSMNQSILFPECRDDDGKCRDTNEIWYDKDKKNKYTCKNEKGVPTITVEYG